MVVTASFVQIMGRFDARELATLAAVHIVLYDGLTLTLLLLMMVTSPLSQGKIDDGCVEKLVR